MRIFIIYMPLIYKELKNEIYHVIEDLKGDESWRLFRILAEFTKGIDALSDLGFAISIFGSARIKQDNPFYIKTIDLANKLSKKAFPSLPVGVQALWKRVTKGQMINKENQWV